MSSGLVMTRGDIHTIDQKLKRLQKERADQLVEKILWELTETKVADLHGLLVKLRHFQALYWPTADLILQDDLEGQLLKSIVSDVETMLDI